MSNAWKWGFFLLFCLLKKLKIIYLLDRYVKMNGIRRHHICLMNIFAGYEKMNGVPDKIRKSYDALIGMVRLC